MPFNLIIWLDFLSSNRYNDNPFSEAQFKTLKYHPSFPDRFGSLQDVRAWAEDFFTGTTTIIVIHLWG